MAGDLIDDHVSVAQCKKAVDALLAHASKKQAEQDESSLLGGKEQHVWLQVAVKKMHPEHKLKPFKIPVKHPLVDPRVTPVCLITKDPQREYKDLLESHGIKFINRVVGITKLKGKFKPFEARRMLLQENGLFLADERVVPLLPGLLGRKFFDAKKQPIPVNLTRKGLKGELERAISSTYMHQNQGTCTSIKIATLTHTPSQVLSNLQTALPAIAKVVKGGWDNIQSLNIKTSSSAALPIWTVELGESRWKAGEERTDGSDVEEADVEMKEVEKKKGKKRAAESVEEEGTPAKKVKSADGKKAKVTAVTESSQDDSTPAKKKRKQASDFIDSSPAPAPSTSISANVPDKKKKKKSTSTAPASEVPPPDTPAVASMDEADVESSDPTLVEPVLAKKEKKKKRKSAAAEESLVEAAAAVVEDVQPPSKKSKKTKEGKEKDVKEKEPAEPAPTPAAPMTPKEKKEKRAAGGGEKKKEKVLKGKKSAAKEGVLGKTK
ncbi:unnamed protein product [Peniophora sp. CBMAI 1063]|nr:unnamed protein product [Peniophora sp. CBMAI 1063]